ncbi:thrombospondin [Plantactinospora sp. WMMB782]|uniref:thrombospondin n=1 Tax=Plantactinospora sp. WMMB782 TaxID=3404121 RepID=UPI003B935EA0
MRHSEPAPTRDENRDGRVDSRDSHDDSHDGRVDSTDSRAERATAGATTTDAGTRSAADRDAAARTGSTATARTEERADAARTDTSRSDTVRSDDTAGRRPGTAVAEPETASRTAPPVAPAPKTEPRRDADGTTEPERGLGESTPQTEPVVVDRGPRPRASMLATLSLVLGVSAAAFVLAGALAGYGIVLGTLALLLGVSGVSATARRHVAGRTDALIGIVLGVGAVVVAVLAMTGQFDWPTTDGDTVVRFREWLDSQFVARF